MGLGKTIQAIGVVNADPSIKSILIFCPASLQVNWQRELEKWCVRKFTGGFAESKNVPNTDIVISSYDIAAKIRPILDKRGQFDLLICDESHYIKSESARRTQAVLGTTGSGKKQGLLPIDARMRLFMTGTPILNRPYELWPILRLIDPEGLGANHWRFAKTYCLPCNAPILMADFTEKKIEDIKIGDKVIGWRTDNFQRRLCVSEVKNVLVRRHVLQTVELNDGTTFTCTPDHEWLSETYSYKMFTKAKTGALTGRGSGKASRLIRVFDTGIKPKYFKLKEYKLGYLTGFFRGDGWCVKERIIKEYPWRKKTFDYIAGHSIGAGCKEIEPLERCAEYGKLLNFTSRIDGPREGDEMYSISFEVGKQNQKPVYEFFTSNPINSDAWWAGFLGGIYDAEGSYTTISQNSPINELTSDMIAKGLDRFKFKYSSDDFGHSILGGRNEFLRFWFIAWPSLKRKLHLYMFGHNDGGGFGHEKRKPDGSGGKFMTRIVRPIKITPLEGKKKVYTLTTETGNYVAYGLASKNCGAWESPWGWDFNGASNLDRLQEELRQRVMIRRLKEDVLPDLPQKQRQIIPIPIDEVRAIVEAERAFYEQNASTIEEARKIAIAAKEANDPLTYETAAVVMKSSKKAIFEEMARLRHATAVAKIPYAISYIEDAFQQQDKVFIIAHHRDVIDAICQKFGNLVVRFDGSVSTTDRQAAIDRFVNDKSVKGFVGGITVAGIGIDGLQKVCSYGLVIEILWTPALLDQMEDRLVRIGQTKPCLFQYLLFDSSIDVSMLKANFNKDEIIDKAVG